MRQIRTVFPGDHDRHNAQMDPGQVALVPPVDTALCRSLRLGTSRWFRPDRLADGTLSQPMPPAMANTGSGAFTGKESLQMLPGDDASAANLAVSKVSGAHLAVEEVTREAGNRRGFVH